MPSIEQFGTRMVQDDPNFTVFVITKLFGIPLYAYYVVVIDRFEDGEVQGTLMTQPFDISGPFTTLEEALTMLEGS